MKRNNQNHFIGKLVKKITKAVTDKAVEKVKKDAEKHVGKDEAERITNELKTKMETDEDFKKGVKMVNTVGTAALTTAAVLGAGAAALGAGAGAAGAGAAGAGKGAAAIGAVGSAASALGKDDDVTDDLYTRGEIPGDIPGKEKIDIGDIAKQVLDSDLAKQKGSELLERIINGSEDTGLPSGVSSQDLVIDDGQDYRSNQKTGMFPGFGFPEGDSFIVIVIVFVILLIILTGGKK